MYILLCTFSFWDQTNSCRWFSVRKVEVVIVVAVVGVTMVVRGGTYNITLFKVLTFQNRCFKRWSRLWVEISVMHCAGVMTCLFEVNCRLRLTFVLIWKKNIIIITIKYKNICFHKFSRYFEKISQTPEYNLIIHNILKYELSAGINRWRRTTAP